MPQEVDDVTAKLNSTLHATLAFSHEWLEESQRALSQNSREAAASSRFRINLQRTVRKETQRMESLCETCLSNDGTQLQRVPAEKQLLLLGAFVCSKFPQVRKLALTILSQMSTEQAKEKTFLALDDPDEEFQVLATRELLSSHSKHKMRLLTKQLESPFQSVRELAIEEVSRQSLHHFVQAHRGLDEDVRKRAASAVMKMKSEQLAAEIEREFDKASPEERIELLLAATAFAGEQQVGHVIAKFLNSPDKRVRATAVKALGTCGGAAALPNIEPLLKDLDPRVRANAVEVVEELKGADAKELLLPLLSDENNRVRGNAAKALWKLGETSAQEAVMEMLKSKEPLMRMSALWVLGEVLPPNVVDIVRPYAERDPDPRARRWAGIVIENHKKRQATNG
jgi:HEAT repeat protein